MLLVGSQYSGQHQCHKWVSTLILTGVCKLIFSLASREVLAPIRRWNWAPQH